MTHKSRPVRSCGVARCLVALFFAAVCAQHAVAQNVADADDDNDAEGAVERYALEEIVVTAEKREQNLQDVPASISALSGASMEFRGIEAPEDLTFSVPSLTIAESQTGTSAQVTIRGIGTENVRAAGDPGVPIHLNGHYLQSTAFVLRDMLDVERVEVLRGPQGTLYGRNAVGGNINIITKRPTEEVEGLFSVAAGNYNRRLIQSVTSGPLGESTRGRIAISDEVRDGYVRDTGTSGQERETSDYTSIRGSLEIDLAKDLLAYVTAYSYKDRGSNIFRLLVANQPFFGPYTVETNSPTNQKDESRGASLDVTWNLSEFEVRSLTAYDNTEKDSVRDLDGSIALDEDSINIDSYETFSQELQVLSSSENKLKWVGGLYYYNERSRGGGVNNLRRFDVNEDGVVDENDPRTVFDASYDASVRSMAVYGQIDYRLTDKWEILAGLRYTNDYKERFRNTQLYEEGNPENTLPFLPPLVLDNRDGTEWSETTGKLGVNYHLSNGALAYASWSRGYKSGGFFISQLEPYDPEIVDAYEVGLKSRWFDNRLQLNASTFYYAYQDKQESVRVPAPEGLIFFGIRNAAEVTAYGGEIELDALIADAWRLDASVSILRAQYDRFESIDIVNPGSGVQDLSGNDVSLAPRWQAHIGSQYEWMIGGFGRLSVRADYSYIDDRWTSAFNRDGSAFPALVDPSFEGDLLPAYDRLDARLRWTKPSEDWTVDVYGNNLTDDVVISNTSVSTPTMASVSYYAPRTYGVKVSFRY